MSRWLLSMMVALGLVAGCAQPQHKMAEHKKPIPAPEMAKLQCWIGNWTGTAEMVSPSPEEMRKKMPEGAKEMPTTFAGGEKWELALGGMFLKCEGWHEMCEGQKAAYIHYMTWDPKAKKYHGWFFSDWGEIGESWMTLDADGKTFRGVDKGTDAQGQRMQGEGTMTLVDDKTMEWTWTGCGPEGKMKFKGTSKRQP
jgi:hypothetical protein